MKWRKTGGGFSECLVGPKEKKEQLVSVGLVFVQHSLEHGFEDLVDNLNLAISLRVISGGILVFKFQLGGELYPNNILEMRLWSENTRGGHRNVK